MRRSLLLSAVCAFSLTAADTMPFTGSWRVNLDKMQAPEKPNQVELGNGMFRCLTCDPKVEVKADGQDHPVKGDPSSDTMNVKIINDKTVEITSKKGGKVVDTGKMTVSGDGNHLVSEDTSYPPNSSEPVTSKTQMRRVGSLKLGMHDVSGSWLLDKWLELSENAKEVSFEETPDGLNAKDQTGFSYSAKFDGKDYPVQGTPELDTVVLKRINDSTVEEILKYKGKVKNTSQMTVSADGKMMTIEWRGSTGFSGKSILEKK